MGHNRIAQPCGAPCNVAVVVRGEDGRALLEGYGYYGRRLDEVTSGLTERAREQGYLKPGGRVLIAADSDDREWKEPIEPELLTKLDSDLDDDAEVEVESDWDDGDDADSERDADSDVESGSDDDVDADDELLEFAGDTSCCNPI